MTRKRTAKSALSRVLDAAPGKAPRAPDSRAQKKVSGKRGGFVSPKEEKGLPYPGDWPNPLGDKNRGCF